MHHRADLRVISSTLQPCTFIYFYRDQSLSQTNAYEQLSNGIDAKRT